MPLEIIEDAFPVVYLKFKGENGLQEVYSSVRFYRRMFIHGEPFAVILDTRDSETPKLEAMKEFSRFTKDSEQDFRRCCAGLAYVISGGVVMRMALRALMQIAKPPFAQITLSDPVEAERWCRAQLLAHTSAEPMQHAG